MREHAAQLPRLPGYSDYAVQSPQPAELSTRYLGSANIRYAHGDKWLILRGRSLEQYGFEQYHALCELLRGHEAFQGRHCCWGDDFIFHCAGEAEGPGNASTWRKVGTHHHLTVVLRLLATAGAP